MTPIQACEETKELWTEIARFAREERRAVKKCEIIGPWEYYKHHCPCCEYVAQDSCYFCPMCVEWKVYSLFLNNTFRCAICEDSRSPYGRWLDLIEVKGSLCIDVEFFCLLIAELADEAIMRLTAESQPTLVEDKDIEYV